MSIETPAEKPKATKVKIPILKEEKKEEEKKKEAFVLKPKKSTSAWIYFNSETVAKLKSEQKMEQKAAFGKSAEIWKGLSDVDKEPYSAKAKDDELRDKKQLKELEEKGYFTTAEGGKSSDLYVDPKKKYGEDCMVPKKPLSAYLFYTTANVNKIKEKENCTHSESMKKCGQIWNTLSTDDRKIYDDKHAEDSKRYQNQLVELDKEGFFIMADGSKSSAHKSKLKKRAKDKKEEKA